MAFPKIEGYVVTEKLGSGSYSTVYKAYTKVGARSIVAVKCVDKSRVKQSGAAIDNLITEIRLLKTLEHPHIVQMKHFTWDDRNIYIIMEYCCGGDLSKYIHKYGRVPENRVLYFLQQLAAALKFLREKGVVHMDLKPHNLLLHKGSDGKYVLKVGDFGFASHLTEEVSRTVRGSPLYMAPEMIAGGYDERVDLWSVGVIMYECLFGKAPYSSATFKELVDKIQRQAPIEIPQNASISPGCRDLLSRLLQHDPDNRISYEDFFSHEYLDLEHMPSKENYNKIPQIASISPGCRDLLSRLLQHDPDDRISYEDFFSHEYLDLEHMPSKENYNKAVRLIKLAVELESGGQLAGALQAYGAGLRHLVPAAGAEADADRRSALAAKLTRYMERAEEIKRILSGRRSSAPQRPPEVPPETTPVPRNPPACCSGQGSSGNIYEFNILRQEQSGAESTAASNGCAVNGDVSEGNHKEEELPSDECKITKDKRGAFARFLKKPVPYLSSKDSSIADEVPDKTPKNEDNDSNCKIT